MDSTSHQNWLGFSLSNHHHMNNINIPSSSDSSNLCLFEAFNTTPTTTTSGLSLSLSLSRFIHFLFAHIFAQTTRFLFYFYINSLCDVYTAQEDNAVAACRPTDISLFTTSGPKLEDFLGCCTTTPPSQQPLGGQFSAETPGTTVTTVSDNSSSEIYDSELKTIAASFLRGYSSNDHQQTGSSQKHQQLLVQSEHAPKKTVDTFGQRTSIYRGVTR
jgi:AP2-like factor (ANT lineage)